MGNIFCFKKNNLESHNTNLLQNTIHCHYCNQTLLFNEYYKHLNNCKRNSVDYHNVYFTC